VCDEKILVLEVVLEEVVLEEVQWDKSGRHCSC